RIEWRIERAAPSADAERAAQAWNRPVAALSVPLGNGDLPAALSLLQLDGPGVISALKPADRGDGIVLRAQGAVHVRLSQLLQGRMAVRIDAAERDLGVLGRKTELSFGGGLSSIRLR